MLRSAESNGTPKAASPQNWPVAGVCFFLVLAVFAVFGQTAGFGFINYDDNKYVYENPVVQMGWTWPGVRWAFTYSEIGHWHPLTWLTHLADCQFYGLSPRGPHLTNVALHAATAVLLFLVLRMMTGFLWRSAFVATVFALHPLRAESVAWIAERKDVLSGVFFMLTLGAYVRFVRQPSFGRYAAMALLFALGLLSKNMLVTLPFVLLLLDGWPLGRLNSKASFWSLLLEKAPLLLLSAASCVATASVAEKIPDANRNPLSARLGDAVVSYLVYMRQLVFPAGLGIPYPFPHGGPPMAKVGAALIVLAGVSAWVLICRKNRPYLLMGWLWFLGMLVPAIGIVQISYYSHADRYTYLPGIGLVLAATWAVADWSAAWEQRRAVLGVMMTAVIGSLAVCAHIQTSYWKDSASLWNHTLACMPRNFVARLNLGDFLRQRGDLDGAIAQFRAALEITPDEVKTLNNLGNVLGMKGETAAAVAQFHKALQIKPEFADTYVNLGYVLLGHGKVDEAIAEFRQALALAPANADTFINLGKALSMKGEDDAAIAQYEKALQVQPGNANVHFNLGNRLLKQGKWDAAALHYRQALELNPGDTEARQKLESALLQKERSKTNRPPP